ncbi:MAG: nuclear transport factor 2 family protein [Rhodospirillaceae bacterium]|nr:MAG: nuclear transport factor 2 family protein [Rhodospirillaceae bacterium]
MDTRDIIDIYQLLNMYGHAVDSPDQSLFPLVFTEDAVFDGRPCGAEIYEGRAAIAAWFALGKPPHPPAHHVTNPVVREEGGEVRVRSKYLFIDPRNGTGATGDYNDVVVRTPDGWRIKHRIVTPRYPTWFPKAGVAEVGNPTDAAAQ